MVLQYCRLFEVFILLVCNIALFRNFQFSRKINFYLIFLFAVLCLYLFTTWLEVASNTKLYFSLNYFHLILTLPPVTFLFFQKLFFNLKFPKKKDIFHFVIPIVLFYGVGNFRYFKYFTYFQFTFFVFYIGFYIKLTTSLFRIHFLQTNNNSIYSKFVFEWAKFIFKFLSAILFTFFSLLFLETFNIGASFKIFFDYLFLVIISLGLIRVFSLINFQFRKFNFANDNLVLGNYDFLFNTFWNLNVDRKILLKKDINLYDCIKSNINEYVSNIDKLSFIDRVFRNKNYSTYDLSKELGLPKYYIVYLYKYHCNINFSEYKRRARVYDSIDLIQKGYLKHNTLNSLSDLVGFSSYNPFLVSFKQVTGLSPFELNKKVKLSVKHRKFDYF